MMNAQSKDTPAKPEDVKKLPVVKSWSYDQRESDRRAAAAEDKYIDMLEHRHERGGGW